MPHKSTVSEQFTWYNLPVVHLHGIHNWVGTDVLVADVKRAREFGLSYVALQRVADLRTGRNGCCGGNCQYGDDGLYFVHLMQIAFVARTPRGRIATEKTYKLLNKSYGGLL